MSSIHSIKTLPSSFQNQREPSSSEIDVKIYSLAHNSIEQVASLMSRLSLSATEENLTSSTMRAYIHMFPESFFPNLESTVHRRVSSYSPFENSSDSASSQYYGVLYCIEDLPETQKAWQLLQQNDLDHFKEMLSTPHIYHALDNQGNSWLAIAVNENNMDAVKLLLEKKFSVNFQNHAGKTALFYAVKKGATEILQLLLEAGANPDITSPDNYTPLIQAADENLIDCVQLLLKANANVAICTKNTGLDALSTAIYAKHTEVVKELLTCHSNLNMHTEFGMTPLLLAVMIGEYNLVKLLLENKALPNIAHKTERTTPLMVAANIGAYNIANLLLKYGAKLDIQNCDGCTAQMVAAIRKHEDIVMLLKETNPYLQARNGNTVFGTGISSEIKDSLLFHHTVPFQTKILYLNKKFPRNSIAVREKNPFTGRTTLTIKTSDEKIQRVYQQVKLTSREKLKRPTGSFKICKPVTCEQSEQPNVRLVVNLNNWQRTTSPSHIEMFMEQNFKIFKLLEGARGISQIELAVKTANNKGKPTIDLYQKKYAWGSLSTVIKKMRLPSIKKMDITLDLLYGLHAMHKLNAAHCDIKPDNILVDATEAVLSDFDFVSFPESVGMARGTIRYFSPQMASCLLYNKAPTLKEQQESDVWAMGLVLHQLWFNSFPQPLVDMEAEAEDKVLHHLFNLTQLAQQNKELPAAATQQFCIGRAIWRMLSVDPKYRVSAAAIIRELEILTAPHG